MVIYGYSMIGGAEYFDIDDPIYGKSHIPVSEFTSSYQGSGSWTHTYFLKSYFRMPFDLYIPSDLVLRRIRELRPLLKLKGDIIVADPRDNTDEQTASIGIAQRIYALGLDALLGTEDLQAEPVGLRVYELDGEVPRAFFDLSEDDEARLLQMSASKLHLEPFARALAVALSLVKEDDVRELRLFRVPALNFEALWISSPDTQEPDLLLPLRNVGRLVVNQPIALDEALVLLREAARPLANMDDLMGA